MIRVLTILSLSLLVGCVQEPPTPQLERIYGAAAKQSHVDRNPIIVIPGILGSKLVEDSTGKIVWGTFGPRAIQYDKAEGMRSLALPFSAEGWPHDKVRPDGVMEKLEVSFGVDFRFKAYSDMLTAFGLGGYLDPANASLDAVNYGKDHFTCFQFAYDWRRSCAENAALLDDFIEEKRAYVARERKRRYASSAPVKFDIVAHSMGGLVARYHLMYGSRPLSADAAMPVDWAGAKHVEKLICVGTPNGGSVYPIKDLLEGFQLARLLPRIPASVIGSMPSAYELLPPSFESPLTDETGEMIDYYNVNEWEKRGWGMMSSEQEPVLVELMPEIASNLERHGMAKAHLAKLLRNARAFHRAINCKCQPPPGVELYCFAGDAVSTATSARLSSSTGVQLAGWMPGDGSVPRRSVLRDMRAPGEMSQRLRTPIQWSGTHFVFSDHVKMTSDPAFVDNVLHLLLEKP